MMTAMTSPIAGLPEYQSTKAGRLLAAAGELLLARGARGFTVADVANRAHVGKGTVYLYWPTKEDLLIGLVGRGFLGLLDDLLERIAADFGLACPSRFCPMMLDVATGQPLLAALQRHDDDLLGVLTDHPRSVALHHALGPSAVIATVLPIWRRHAMARTDWELPDQEFALHALITGIAMSIVRPDAGPAPAGDPLCVLADSVTALLGPDRSDDDQIAGAAADVMGFLRTGRATALRLIAPAHPPTGASPLG